MAGVSLDPMIPRDFESHVSGNSTQNTGTTATSIRLADLDTMLACISCVINLIFKEKQMNGIQKKYVD